MTRSPISPQARLRTAAPTFGPRGLGRFHPRDDLGCDGSDRAPVVARDSSLALSGVTAKSLLSCEAVTAAHGDLDAMEMQQCFDKPVPEFRKCQPH